MMNSSNSKSPSPARERRRTPMACTKCRSRKLKCQPVEHDSAPCERCVKDGIRDHCEYRPVDPSSASNNQTNYEDNPVILLPAPAAPPLNQEYALPVNHPSYIHTQGGYVSDPTFNPNMQVPFQNPQYPYHQQHPSSSYPEPQYPYTNSYTSGYPADQSNYQSHPSSQFVGHPQYPGMSFPPPQGQGSRPYDHRFYPNNGYDSQNMYRE